MSQNLQGISMKKYVIKRETSVLEFHFPENFASFLLQQAQEPIFSLPR